MKLCATCGGKSVGTYCSPLCAIGTAANDTTHNPDHAALIEPSPEVQALWDEAWSNYVAATRAGFTEAQALDAAAAWVRWSKHGH